MKIIRPLLFATALALVLFLVFRPGQSNAPEPSPVRPSTETGQVGSSSVSPRADPGVPSARRVSAAVDSGAADKPTGASWQATDGADSIVKEELTESEQHSLAEAFSEARRAVRAIPESWAEREENLGYDFYALHPKQHLTARFGAEAVQFVSSERTYTGADADQPSTSWEARMRLRSFAGREVAAGSPPKKSPESGSRVAYRRAADLTEWFDNGTEAMEHGFTVHGRPGHLADGEEVVLEMDLEGLEAVGRDAENGSDLVFRDGGRDVLGYEKLVVFDAAGRELPARMEPTEGGFLLAYHDTEASYPVTVDPLIVNEEAKFNRIDAAAGDQFGQSVAIFEDTAVIGAPLNDDAGTSSGSAYVFIRTGSNWGLQAKLTASDAAAGDEFGGSVSISGDTVVVGARLNDHSGSNAGSAYVFTRSGDNWSEQAKLTALDAAAGDLLGRAVSVSGDTVVAGADGDGEGGTLSGSAYVFVRTGTSWSQQEKLTASDAAIKDRFGWSVAISGDTVVVGADGDDDGGFSSGSAYVFTRSGTSWSQQEKLTAPDAAGNDRFGAAVAVSADTVVVGAYGDDDGGSGSGSAYVFTRSGTDWSQQEKLTASDAAADSEFGKSVAISEDTILIGAPSDDDGEIDSGSAYFFIRSDTNWSEQEKLTYLNNVAGDELGRSVAISGDTAVFGSPMDDDQGSNSGSAEVVVLFDGSWIPMKTITASDAGSSDSFGSSVSISGDTVVVGTPGDDDRGGSSGSAYVFTRSVGVWSEQAKLIASDAQFGDEFGKSVSISGDTVVVGAYKDSDGGTWSGSAYVFIRSGNSWSEQTKLTASDPEPADIFGHSVSISGDTVVVGAEQDDDAGNSSGSAYVFTRHGSAWTQQAKLTASDAQIDDHFGGSVSIFEETLVIGASQDKEFGTRTGSAYVFTRSDDIWSEQAKLTASDAANEDLFGASVSIFGDSVVVGAPNNNDGGTNSGSAYVFTRSDGIWSEQGKLTASDAAADDEFGWMISISGNTVVVGAPGGLSLGSAYAFTRDGGIWSEQAKLTASDEAAGDQFGKSVSISGDTVVVGSEGNDDGDSNSGSAYVYRLAVPSARILLLTDHLGTTIGSGGNASAFDAQRTGTSRDYLFTLTNSGELDLDLQSISLGGTDSGQFGLTLPDISSAADLAQGESVNLTVTFQPVGASGPRDAILITSSNDTDTPVHSVNLSGVGLSDSTDSDGDGMNDWPEHALRGFGFDWETAQDNLVSDYYALAPEAGLVALDDVAAIQAGANLLNVDPATNRAEFTIELKQSDDLTTFNPLTIEPGRVSVDAEGRLVYEVDAPDGKHFFLMEVGP